MAAGRPDTALFWSDASVLGTRVTKSAAALVAIRLTLEQHGPLKGREAVFLTAAKAAARFDPVCFGRVWADPSAYYWVRMAYRLIGACGGGRDLDALGQAYCRAIGFSDPCAALRHHLQDFGRFLLGLCVIDGSELVLDPPLRVDLPFAVPGTRFVLEGAGCIDVTGFTHGSLSAEASGQRLSVALKAGASAAGVSIIESPLLEVEGCEVRLQPAALAGLHGLDFVDPILRAGATFQADNAPLVADAMRLVARHAAETLVQFRDAVEVIALKPARSGGYTNLAHSDLPGAFVAAVVDNPYEFADTLVHEFHHNRLFALEEDAPFFEEDARDPFEDMCVYSPWRDDARALHGLLHGTYVFVPVWRFWRSVTASGEATEGVDRYARERLARIHLQLEIGLHQLASSSCFTSFGQRLYAELRSCVDAMPAELASLGVTAGLPAMRCDERGCLVEENSTDGGTCPSVLDAVRGHVRDYAPPDQAASLLRLPVLTD